MAVTHLEAGHLNLKAGETAETASSPGPFAAFGIIAGGVFGMIGGLAQYNALYTGAPQFVLPTMFVFAGGLLGAPLLGIAGWAVGKLVEWIKHR